jgi:PAS domain S-box-containing protein
MGLSAPSAEGPLRVLLDCSPDAIVVVARDGRIAHVNASAEALFGYAAGELVGQPIEALVPEHARAGHATVRDGYAASPRVRAMGSGLALRGRRKDGSEVPVEISLSPISPGLAGEAGPLVAAAIRDVSERQRAAEDRALLASVVDSSNDAIITKSLDGVITSWNLGAERLFGYRARDIMGRQVGAIVPPEATAPEAALLARVMAGERVEAIEVPRVRHDGTILEVSVTMSPLRDASGAVVGVSSVSRDVTDRRRMVSALARAKEASETATRELAAANAALRLARDTAEAANHAKSAFLANMSHEIRTPMNAILGYAQLLQRSQALGGKEKDQLDVILRSGDHLLNLINDVLEMSKIEAGARALKLGALDLPAMLDDLERMMRLRCAAKRLAFEVNHAPDVPRFIVADEGKLRQVLVNLMSNAVKFTARGGVVVRVMALTGADACARLVVDVEDTGPGISTDELAGLFRPFAQARVGLEAQGGTGLGLALSRDFARLMGGDVTARSVVGAGSVFRLVLPLEVASAPAAEGSHAPPRQVIGLRGDRAPRVLVVDDDVDNRSWVAALLGDVGFEIRQAENGAEALSIAAAWPPRLVLMDLHMPVLGGAAAIRALRASTPLSGAEPLSIVAVSATAFADMRATAFAAGADGWLAKPYREGPLFEEVARLLGVEYELALEAAPLSRDLAPPASTALFASLAPELVRELRDAARVADYERLQELIGSLPPQLHRVAEDLHQLLERYAYDELVHLGDPPSSARLGV